MEAMLFALDTINADSQLLPGIELGYDIRDTCYSENIGLDEALDLIISGEHLSLESCLTFLGGRVSESVATLGIVGAYASRVSLVSAPLHGATVSKRPSRAAGDQPHLKTYSLWEHHR